MIVCICSSYFSNQHTSSNAWSSIGDGEIRSLRLFDIVSYSQKASAGKHSVVFISTIMYESLRSIPWTLERGGLYPIPRERGTLFKSIWSHALDCPNLVRERCWEGWDCFAVSTNMNFFHFQLLHQVSLACCRVRILLEAISEFSINHIVSVNDKVYVHPSIYSTFNIWKTF